MGSDDEGVALAPMIDPVEDDGYVSPDFELPPSSDEEDAPPPPKRAKSTKSALAEEEEARLEAEAAAKKKGWLGGWFGRS